MSTVLVIGSADDRSLPPPFVKLAIAAEREVRQALESRSCTVRFVDTAHPPFPDMTGALRDVAGLILLGGGDIDPTLYGLPADQPGLYGVDRVVDDYTIEAVCRAREAGLPIFGICRGAQVINVAYGGSIIPDILNWQPHHGPTAETIFVPEQVTLTQDSRLARILQSTVLTVQSGHHQAIDRVAEGFAVTGTAVDGIVEAIESADESEWIVGIQWHPEHADADPQARDQLFAAFVEQTEKTTIGVSR
ncbi:gamma-glutamyl-gamma-aminobutyrate hydrolase family protein [Mycobacterium sp. SMC-4]|uniref:gamma-glutamyl-gamma-aminobutyrate hydrolase family protein n=1 Tax=Mycobacterium sp. SMC-4 TaxID=2857059 RepID=UPI003D07A67F